MSLFSTRLRIVLEKNGINQVELAKRTNLTPSHSELLRRNIWAESSRNALTTLANDQS